MGTTFLVMSVLSPIFFLIVEFFIYKSKFNKFAQSDTPSNLKLALDIIFLAVLWYIAMIVVWFALWLLMVLILPLAAIVWILSPVIVIVIYYFILKFLAWRHTTKENAKQISDQTLVFTFLFGIIYYIILTLMLMPMLSQY